MATRAKACLIIASILCAWGAMEAFVFEKAQLADPYKVYAQEERLQQIREAVPPDAVIGYVTDLAPGSVAASAAFNSAQYVLAPRILRRDAHHRFVLGMVSKPGDEITLAHAKGLQIVLPFQNGAVLYRNEAAP